jgi:hypothetical protein
LNKSEKLNSAIFYPLTANSAKNTATNCTHWSKQFATSQSTTNSASQWVLGVWGLSNHAKIGRLRTKTCLHHTKALEANVANGIHALLLLGLTRTTSGQDILSATKPQCLLLGRKTSKLARASQTQLSALHSGLLVGKVGC